MTWPLGDISGSEVLTDLDHLYPSHVNNLRQSMAATATVGTTTECQYYCDGTADQVQIQAAVDYVASLGGGKVFIKRGTYNLAAGVNINNPNIIIEGEGVGSTILTCGYHGAYNVSLLLFLNSTYTLGLNNNGVKNISINLNAYRTSGICFRGAYSANVTSKNIFVDNVELYGKAADASGSIGMITVIGDYSTLGQGHFDQLNFNRLKIRDGGTTSATYAGDYGILILDDYASNVTFRDCVFENLYSVSIGNSSGVTRGCRNWTLDNCSFVNTKKKYVGQTSGTYDFYNGQRTGFDGIKFLGCTFDNTDSGWVATQEVFDITSYNCHGLVIDHCYFLKSRAVIAPGTSSPTTNETIASKFSNNIVYDCLSFIDPDGEWAASYTDNIFYHVDALYLSGYGYDYGTVYDGNLFYNCVYDLTTGWHTYEYQKGIFIVEQGGVTIQNNILWDDLGVASKIKYFVYELPGVAVTLPNVYKNNTILGADNMTCAFFLDAYIDHVIDGNSGLPEHRIYNRANLTVVGDEALTVNDVVKNNYDHSNDLIDYQAYSLGNITGATTVNVGWGEVQKGTLTGNIVVTMSTGMYEGQELTLILTQGGTGSYTYTKNSTNNLAGGAVTLTAAVGSVDILKFRWDGTEWYEISRSLNVS